MKLVDDNRINKYNFKDFLDEFTAPECARFPELDDDEKKFLNSYSAGWIAYVLYGQTPEVDQVTKRFKPPTFPDDFPRFWEEFISLATRENYFDRPGYIKLSSKLSKKKLFDYIDFVSVSSKLLNHDDFLIEDPIGAGGESIIYLATNRVTGERHACKKLKYKIHSQEIKKIIIALEKLDNIVFGIRYIGLSLRERDVFLHMEYAANGSLADLILLDRRMKAPSWFNEASKIRLAREIAEGMRSLHDEGIIHKDLKPENVILDSNNSVKICDFSFIPEDGAATLLFMSPELINGGEATFKSDVYSFAVTLACLFGGGEMIGTTKASAVGGFRPSIAVSTPSSIQSVIRKCWQQNPDDRPTFSEIVDDINRADLDNDDLRIKSMDEFPGFKPEVSRGILSDDCEYEICDIVGDIESVEHFIRLHMTIQPENMLHIHKYCKLSSKIVLIIERNDRVRFDTYLSAKKRVSATRGEKYVSDFISVFELYHKNGFCFGPFSLRRLFFRGRHLSSICFDLFDIPGLVRPKTKTDDEEIFVNLPEVESSREGDVFSFACFVLKIFNCFEKKEDGKISTQPFKRVSYKNVGSSKPQIPPRYTGDNTMQRCLSDDPKKRPTFELLFQKLFPVQYRIISNFLSVSVSRFSTFSMSKDFRQEDIEFFGLLGQGTYGKVIHAVNHATNEDLAVKEFNDISGKRNEDFMLEFVALKAIDHPNIIKIIGASQRKESSHGSRLFMEFAGGGDLKKNMEESFEAFIVHMLQVSSAMKYLHQRGIVHLDLKPENILIRDDGSAVVADFNTAMHVDIDTHLQNQRGSESYMSPELLCLEPYSFSTDVFSFGLIVSEYFSPDAHRIIREVNKKRERPSLDFIPDTRLRSLLEFCVDDDPMSRPSFDFICSFIFKKFFKDTPDSEEFERLTQISRIDEDKLNQLRVLASRGSNEAIVEYAKYLLCENSFSDAMHTLLKGAKEGDANCQNTFGVLSMTSITDQIVEREESEDFIRKASEQGDKFGMTNYGIILLRDKKIRESLEILEKAFSKGVAFAGYMIGSIYNDNEIDEMSEEERKAKAVEYFKDAASYGDPSAQVKYGDYLKEKSIVDDDGFDCVHYFRLSAYQRCREGCERYCEHLEGERKEYYASIIKSLQGVDHRFEWSHKQYFLDEMLSSYTGMLLLDVSSKDRFNFLCNRMFQQ